MAMPPPGMGPGAMMPPRPPASPVPGGPPPMPPGMPMSMPPPPPPVGGLGPASPLAGMLADLPTNLSPGWQAIDMGIRCFRTALRSADMQQAEKVVAVIQSLTNTATKLLSAYTERTSTGATEPTLPGRADDGPPPPAPDADGQPASASLSEEPAD